MVDAVAPAPARASRPSADPTRERILAAALDLFSERSFEGATTREIAARAGVTQPLLNYHFQSKDALWRAAVDALFDSLSEALSTRAEGLRGVDELTVTRLIVREFIFFSARHPQLHRIITQECKVDGPRMDWLVERHIRPLYDSTVERFARSGRTRRAARHPGAASLLHRYRRRSDHVRARPRMPSSQRPRPE